MATHTLHITSYDSEDEEYDWTVTCDGPKQECQVWYECQQVGCSIPSPFYDSDGQEEVERHGIEHKFIDGAWMTLSNQCAAVSTDVTESVWEIARDRGVGDWPVDVDYLGDGQWALIDATPEETKP